MAKLKIVSELAGMGCPKCGAHLNIRPVLRTLRPQVYRNSIPYTRCQECNSKVRLRDSPTMIFAKLFFVFLPTLLFATFLGLAIVEQMPPLSFYLEAKDSIEPNVLGFAVVLGVFVAPALLLCLRTFRVEVID